MGNESLIVPTREPTAIELARYEKQLECLFLLINANENLYVELSIVKS
jgi:hypothetical protein